METPLKFYYPHPQLPLFNSRPSPPQPPNNHHRPNLLQQRQRHQQHGGSRLPMRHLTFLRISPNRFINSLNRSLRQQFIMSESDQKKEKDLSVDALKSTMDVKQEPENSEPIPPPPEKPLPGDCCGSGCVRCVWDIYYEELEEYNNLLKSKTEHTVNPKSS